MSSAIAHYRAAARASGAAYYRNMRERSHEAQAWYKACVNAEIVARYYAREDIVNAQLAYLNQSEK